MTLILVFSVFCRLNNYKLNDEAVVERRKAGMDDSFYHPAEDTKFGLAAETTRAMTACRTNRLAVSCMAFYGVS